MVRAALESELHRVILVIGPSDSGSVEALGPVAADPRLSQVVNPSPQAGMSSSMRTGMESLDRKAAGVMILLGDQPGITGNIINELLTAFRREQTKIVVPVVIGRRTTPVIFPATLFPELMEEAGDIGGRNVLKRHVDQVVELEIGQEYDDTDLDTPEDLNEIRSKTRRVTRESRIMKIRLAKTAGFCMGVRRAVDMVLDLQRDSPPLPIVTYGPLIHNPQTLELLRSRGIQEAKSLDQISGGTVVIRAHGISPQERHTLESKGVGIIDATCPRVARVQAVIRKHAGKGHFCVIVGDEDHPEVRGLMGFASAGSIAIPSLS